jgi:hypothetical protein
MSCKLYANKKYVTNRLVLFKTILFFAYSIQLAKIKSGQYSKTGWRIFICGADGEPAR